MLSAARVAIRAWSSVPANAFITTGTKLLAIRGVDRSNLGGDITLLLGIGVVIIAALRPSTIRYRVRAVLGLVALAIGAYRVTTVGTESGRVGHAVFTARERVGGGLWLTVLASALIVGISAWLSVTSTPELTTAEASASVGRL